MKLVSHGKTSVGMKRTGNEDSFYHDDTIGLYIVADGMGGHNAGEVASNIAVKSIREHILKQEVLNESSLSDAIYIANGNIFKQAKRNTQYSGMGTTVTSMLIKNAGATLCHVGDSRAYLLSEGKLVQLTEDHTYVNEQYRNGFISYEQMGTHTMRNVLTRSLGFSEYVKVDSQKIVIHPGNRFILCSDGLTHMVKDDIISELVSMPDIYHAASTLIDVANANGGDDNITVIIIDVIE